jgi:UDPglucose 6-dehydrogenase
VLVLTEWNEFRAIDLDDLRKTMRGNLIIDTRNIFVPADAEAAGFEYQGIGRPGGAKTADTVDA